MSSESKPSKQWLSLNEAAQQLGVHPVTLRRWADDGEIPVMVTPGGHRRFAVAGSIGFQKAPAAGVVVAGISVWADRFS
jgi:excisionase family DNA binding protein